MTHKNISPTLSLARHLVIIGLLIFASISISAQVLPEIVPGKLTEGALKGGQTEAYMVRLEAGQFLHLAVDQNGIDIKINLSAPDGTSVVSMDGPNGKDGPEQIAVIAGISGDHRLEIVSVNKTAAPGSYKINIVNLRPPTDIDRQRVAAEHDFVEAYMKLRPQRTAVARRAAIEKMQGPIAFYKAVGDEYRAAWITYAALLLHAQSGEFRTAFEQANAAAQMFRSVKDVTGEAIALNMLGGMSDVLGDPQGALVYYSQALPGARATNSKGIEGSILNNIGKIHYDLADWQKAVEFYAQALPILRANGNQASEAITLHNMGVAYAVSGDFDKATSMLDQALPLRRVVGDKAGEADTLTSIGWMLNSTGRSEEALKYYDQAMTLRLPIGDRRAEGVTLDHIGIAYASTGQPAKALEYHEKALERHRSAESPRTEGIALTNIGNVQNILGEPRKALEVYEQALVIFRRIGDRQNEARALEGIARAERSLGNFSQAQAHLEQGLELIEAVRSTAGAQQARSAYLASRHGAYELYIDLLMQLHREDPAAGFDSKALQASERVRARSLIDLLSQARVDIRKGVDPALIARERQLGDTLNAKAQRQIQIRAQKGGSIEELERLGKEIVELEIKYQQVKASIRNTSPTYAGLTQPRPLTLSEIQGQLDPQTLLLEYSLGDERSYLWAVSSSGLTSYELPGRKEIQQSARKVYELLTARTTEKQGETPAQRGARMVSADSDLIRSAGDLSRMVLAPAAAEMVGKRIVVVADDALQYVPFAIMPVSGASTNAKGQRAVYRPLMADHEIITLPSVSALAVHRNSLAGRQPGINAVAVIADPVFSAEDARLKSGAAQAQPEAGAAAVRKIEHIAEGTFARIAINRLPFTRNEADQILALSPGSANAKVVDFNATRDAVVSGDLGRFRYVHFATHGYLDSARPDLSALVLSLVDKDGKPEDGFLRAHDIYNLDLPAELVVLSACQTGLGKEIKGEGLVGLTRGFMYAGARRVVVSLWNVNDKATAELMRRFYRGMLRENMKPAAALRKAQAEMAQQPQWRSPYYWAAFTIQGDWN